ncbi:MAG: hypothetical protein DDG60_04140 [Anaerolineae bacterium]|nr:MAG: hypothetical protein DDG60_04140 [Anaerolineae bacterium]
MSSFPGYRFGSWLAFFVLAIFLGACVGLPAAAPTVPIAGSEPASLPSPTEESEPRPLTDFRLPAIPEQRSLVLDYPAVVRVGDTERVYLTLEVDEQGNATPVGRVSGNLIQEEGIQIPNIYDTHYVWVEARLDMPGMHVKPAELVSETMFPGQTISFFWSLQPAEVANYKGTVWLYLRFLPKDGRLESRRALSAQLIEIQVVSLYGLGADAVRWLGLLGMLFGAVLGFPFLEEVFRRWLSRRGQRRTRA